MGAQQKVLDPAGSRPSAPLSVVASRLVHAYTASGIVLAFLMVIAVMEGDTVRGLWLFPGGHARRRHRRLPRPATCR
ncbi:hypothetical protein [Nocardioides sp. B-3]|uniref:hypothetical protein n=1 Tax=Nocardioides sp. B-3 TaxID=2895565 RepID=UPI0021525C63|nr:hypothetical protein [Nocardioides sp. B-3]UUZ60367.1 hypothetical protein LP418_05515 [Nocardioides sp. B-3]